jgi:serine/threonine protein kinase
MAWHEKRDTVATAAQDIWALGAMVFEAFSQVAAVNPFGGREACVRLARGEEQYPWEGPQKIKGFSDSRAHEVVKACLARDPAERPSAAALVQQIRQITHCTTCIA